VIYGMMGQAWIVERAIDPRLGLWMHAVRHGKYTRDKFSW